MAEREYDRPISLFCGDVRRCAIGNSPMAPRVRGCRASKRLGNDPSRNRRAMHSLGRSLASYARPSGRIFSSAVPSEQVNDPPRGSGKQMAQSHAERPRCRCRYRPGRVRRFRAWRPGRAAEDVRRGWSRRDGLERILGAPMMRATTCSSRGWTGYLPMAQTGIRMRMAA